jgi:prevent-host-death family protein
MAKYTVTYLRAHLSNAIDLTKEKAVEIERNGEIVAVLVSKEVWDQAQEAWEELADIAAAEDARSSGPNVSLEQLQRDLGYLPA